MHVSKHGSVLPCWIGSDGARHESASGEGLLEGHAAVDEQRGSLQARGCAAWCMARRALELRRHDGGVAFAHGCRSNAFHCCYRSIRIRVLQLVQVDYSLNFTDGGCGEISAGTSEARDIGLWRLVGTLVAVYLQLTLMLP